MVTRLDVYVYGTPVCCVSECDVMCVVVYLCGCVIFSDSCHLFLLKLLLKILLKYILKF